MQLSIKTCLEGANYPTMINYTQRKKILDTKDVGWNVVFTRRFSCNYAVATHDIHVMTIFDYLKISDWLTVISYSSESLGNILLPMNSPKCCVWLLVGESSSPVLRVTFDIDTQLAVW